MPEAARSHSKIQQLYSLKQIREAAAEATKVVEKFSSIGWARGSFAALTEGVTQNLTGMRRIENLQIPKYSIERVLGAWDQTVLSIARRLASNPESTVPEKNLNAIITWGKTTLRQHLTSLDC